jgi:hypothetical protein
VKLLTNEFHLPFLFAIANDVQGVQFIFRSIHSKSLNKEITSLPSLRAVINFLCTEER